MTANTENNTESEQTNSHQKGIMATFASHRVASNLLMFLMILAGLFALKKINSQFFPSFELDYISVNFVWSGASAEDVEEAITIPVEQELKSLTEIKQLTSSSKEGGASIVIEVDDDYDTSTVLEKVKQRVSAVRNLPAQAEQPVISRIENYSPVANMLITGHNTPEELDHLARSFERQLLERGISKINLVGFPTEEIAIEVSSEMLVQTGLSLSQITEKVRANSRNIPAGTAAKDSLSKQVRSLSQQYEVSGFEELEIGSDSKGRVLRLRDVATVIRRPKEDQPFITWKDQPAVELALRRTESDDTLTTADIFNEWLDETRPNLPDGVEIHVFHERYKSLRERINLLLTNGAGGLILVIIILFLFLNVRVAFWVTLGIPVAFLATLAVMQFVGSSINMISLFALIMALGIIVDDAIVVGEDTLSHTEAGESSRDAAIGGAQRMWIPVLSSSLTTMAAFLPLAMVGGIMGKIMFELPLVVICMIIASLVECFLILPGHLLHSLKKKPPPNPNSFHSRFDKRFRGFRENHVRPLVEKSIKYNGTILISGLCMFILSVSLVASGHIKFNFFPTIDANTINASVDFQPGTSSKKVSEFLTHMEEALDKTEAEYGGDLVSLVISYHNRAMFDEFSQDYGPEKGALVVEFKSSERPATNDEFIAAWRKNIDMPSGINKFKIAQRNPGPGGPPIGYRIMSNDLVSLKAASNDLQAALRDFNGVSNVDDDLPYGKEQLIYELTPTGRKLGLSTQAIGMQLRAAFDGEIAQIFYDGSNEIEVRVSLPREEKGTLQALNNFPIVLPSGDSTPLSNVVSFTSRQGLQILRHTDGVLNTTISADINQAITNSNEIRDALEQDVFPKLQQHYGVRFGLEGQALDQQQTVGDMKTGLIIGCALIFIILAWVFSSYSWPIAVMSAIPLGLTGAIFGHLLLNTSLSIFSLMGLFGLSGIVINDSIVLITFFGQLRRQGVPLEQAIVDSVCARFRAVLLTSLTTIAGLLPILFETSLQAQFLIPMAISIVFGLAYGTFLILFFIPGMIILLERLRNRLGLSSRFTTQEQA